MHRVPDWIIMIVLWILFGLVAVRLVLRLIW